LVKESRDLSLPGEKNKIMVRIPYRWYKENKYCGTRRFYIVFQLGTTSAQGWRLGFREAQNKRRFQINYKLAKSYFDSNYKLFMGEISNPLSFDMCWGNDAITLIRRFKMTLHK
jgi:hypothetical protein